jgi:RHS repeat-associated protein
MSGTQLVTYQQKWDIDNRLVVVTNTTSSQVTQYFYDADGTRVKRISPQGTTIYVNADYEVTGPSQMVAPPSTLPPTYTHKLYLPVVSCAGCNGIPSLNEPLLNLAPARVTYRFNGQQVAVREGVTVTYVYGDHLGSASVTANLTGTKVSEARYYPFGETRYSNGSLPSDRTFTGQRADSYSNMYDMGARWYSPVFGRFISPDSIVLRPGDPQTLNRYAYGRNNPLRYTDPTGHDFEDFAAFLTGIAYGWGNANTHIAGLSLLPEEAHRNAEALTVQSADFAIGRMVGDGIAIWQGLAEAGGGIGGAAGGGLLCLTGVGCIVGGPAMALSGVLVVHGSVTAINASTDLGTQMMLFAQRQANANSSPKGLTGKAFEDWVQNKLGAKPWTKNKVFDLQSADGKTAIQVKGGSGFFNQPEYKIYGYFGNQLGAAKEAGMPYEFHTNEPIPQFWKDWMTQKGIKFFEW